MRFCPNCGAQVPETSKFCTECGEKLSPVVEPAPAPEIPDEPAKTVPPAPEIPDEPAKTVPPAPVYTEPEAAAVPPAAPAKEKKPMNKKTVMIVAIAAAVVILAIILIIAFGGSGADAADPNLGIYNAVACESSGISLDCDDEWIELKAKGKAEVFLLGEKYTGKWSLDEDEFLLTQAGDEFEGTLKDGVLILDYDGLVYTYEKEGRSAPDEPGKTDKPAEPEKASEIGYWTLLYTEGEEAMDEETVETLKGLGMEIFIELKEDGTGTFMVDEATAITWADGKFGADGESFSYTVENGQLISEIYGTKYFFVPGEGSAPAVPAAPAEPTEKPLDSEYAWWNGDWYGWWIVQSGTGAYESWEDSYWDTYATIDVYDDDTGWMDLWDTDTTYDSPLASMEVYFGAGVSEHGTMRVESGYFMDYEFAHADWGADPGAMGFDIEDMIWIDFEYVDPADPNDTMDVYIFLRPWGMKWDDIAGKSDASWPYDDMMPMYYYDWYLPLVDRGYELPDSYQDGLGLLNGGSNLGSGEILATDNWEDCRVDVLGAELFSDWNGKDAIRVYYDFTNTGTDTTYAAESVSISVSQDEYEQYDTTAPWDEVVPEDGNAYLAVRPGVTIRCIAEYPIKLSGGDLVMEFSNYWNDKQCFTVYFDPQDLPGRPPKWEEEFIGSPNWLDGVPESGKVGDYSITLDHVDIVEGYEDVDVFKVVLNYTNHSAEAASISWYLGYRAFQNGIELNSTSPYIETDADRMLYEEVLPGQSAQVALCYSLRNEQSPVEFEIFDYWSGDKVGKVYELTWGG